MASNLTVEDDDTSFKIRVKNKYLVHILVLVFLYYNWPSMIGIS